MKNRRWLWLLVLLPLVVGLLRLRLDTEVLHLLPGDLPEVKGLKLWQEHFGGSRDLLITLRSDEAESAAQVAHEIADALRAQEGLTAAVYWQAPWREHPGESAEIAAAAWLNSPTGDVAELAERLQPAKLEPALANLRSQLSTSLSPEEIGRLSYDPLQLMDVPSLQSNAAQFGDDGPPFASADGTFRVVHVETPEVFGDYRAAGAWLAQVHQVVDRVVADEKESKLTEQHFTGGPEFLVEIASDMERDMKRSITGTAIVVGLLFFLVHRRIKPLAWLVTLLAFVLLSTMAAGGLFFGRLNVVSMGFAAILLGLAVDYGLVVYQERLAHPRDDLREVLRATAPGIWWSAITTAGAFFLLNFGGLPGLAQLGTLVATGILVAAAVMLGWFPKPLEPSSGNEGAGAKTDPAINDHSKPSPRAGGQFIWIVTGFVIVLGLLILFRRAPSIDASSQPLRPARSMAYDAMDEMRKEIGGDETWAVLVTGTNEQEVADRLHGVDEKLASLKSEKEIQSAVLPGTLWPDPRNQTANRAALENVVDHWSSITSAVLRAGFTVESMALAQGVVATWRKALADPKPFWPKNSVSRWIMREMSVRDSGMYIAAGAIKPTNQNSADWVPKIQNANVLVAGWERLGPALLDDVETKLKWVLAGIVAVVLLTLQFTFRNAVETSLSIAALIFSGLVLFAIMSVAGWSWNLMNLMAVPLLLGSTVDYSIHMQLSLRRHLGDLPAIFNATGKALLLCAATTAAGFGSLAFSSNAGLASLGKVCAAGAAGAVLTACFLLPRWWLALVDLESHARMRSNPKQRQNPSKASGLAEPSRLYGAFLWKLGLGVVRRMPIGFARAIGRAIAFVYRCFAQSRRHTVMTNLLPVFAGDRAAAIRATNHLFRNFGIKLADLMRYESGCPVDDLFCRLPAPEEFTIDRSSGRGTLLLTIHLGNWEFGAPLLRRIGVNLLVITLAEPGRGFTELREAARKRWGVETMVIGQDAFAFVEVLKRLQDGATIALLIDRPPRASAVDVDLFGQPFPASVSAAELARASGCALLPVAIPSTPAGYEVISLPEIQYDRAQLGNRDARKELTREIVRAFEPVIRQHPDQWFHFVPIWK